MFECRPIDVVVSRVAIDETIEENCIEGKPPVLGRGCKGVVSSLAPVTERVDSVLVLVQIVQNVRWVISVRFREKSECRKKEAPNASLYHGYHSE